MGQQNHIHPEVRKVVSQEVDNVTTFDSYSDTGARIECEEFNYVPVKNLNELGYTVGGIKKWGDGVRIYIVPTDPKK